MSYPSTGVNHHNSVKAEKTVSKYKEDFEKYYNKKINKIVHIGGTQTKVDYKIYFEDGTIQNESLKSKKNIKSGSFDYVNTSNFNYDNVLPETFKIYTKYRGSKVISNYPKLTKSISDEMKTNLTSDLLTQLFKELVINKYEKDNISLTIEDRNTNTLYVNVLPYLFEFINNGGKLVLRILNKNSMSYKIDGINSDGTMNTEFNLRVRIHLNNGKTKWLNNDSSSLVLKFQQDSVYKLIK
jgi:hypothetical protein